MKKHIPIFFFIFLMLSMVSSCYYDNEESLYPNNTQPCDTSNVTYSQSISLIMNSNCNVCHSQAIHSGSVITDNPIDLKNIALDHDRLLNAVNWTGQFHMPKGGNQLPSCDRSKIRIWVLSGAPDN